MSYAISEAFNGIKNLRGVKLTEAEGEQSVPKYDERFCKNFMEVYNDYYKFLYDNYDNDFIDTVQNLGVQLCEKCIEEDKDFKELIQTMAKYRQDYFTSDREYAAFFFTALTQVPVKY